MSPDRWRNWAISSSRWSPKMIKIPAARIAYLFARRDSVEIPAHDHRILVAIIGFAQPNPHETAVFIERDGSGIIGRRLQEHDLAPRRPRCAQGVIEQAPAQARPPPRRQ